MNPIRRTAAVAILGLMLMPLPVFHEYEWLPWEIAKDCARYGQFSGGEPGKLSMNNHATKTEQSSVTHPKPGTK
jgi:hypothetical protein